MTTNEGYYGVTRTDEYLAHYGIKGMKWGVRKAIESGNSARLGRQYRKAQKKLAKLEARANNGKKYAKRAAALGAGAAAAGGLAVAGTTGVGRAARDSIKAAGVGAGKVGGLMMKSRNAKVRRAGIAVMGAGTSMQKGANGVGDAVTRWGGSYSMRKSVQKGLKDYANNSKIPLNAIVNGNPVDAAKQKSRQVANTLSKKLNGGGPNKVGHYLNNANIARIGAAAVGAGLAGGAAYNAYRAATTKRAAKKAAQFRSEMNKAFAGTQYGKKPRQGKRRRG